MVCSFFLLWRAEKGTKVCAHGAEMACGWLKDGVTWGGSRGVKFVRGGGAEEDYPLTGKRWEAGRSSNMEEIKDGGFDANPTGATD